MLCSVMFCHARALFCNVLSCHVVLCRVCRWLCCPLLWHVAFCRVRRDAPPSCYDKLSDAVSLYDMFYQCVLCYAWFGLLLVWSVVFCSVVFCSGLFCDVMLCHVLSCSGMPAAVLLCYIHALLCHGVTP